MAVGIRRTGRSMRFLRGRVGMVNDGLGVGIKGESKELECFPSFQLRQLGN